MGDQHIHNHYHNNKEKSPSFTGIIIVAILFISIISAFQKTCNSQKIAYEERKQNIGVKQEPSYFKIKRKKEINLTVVYVRIIRKADGVCVAKYNIDNTDMELDIGLPDVMRDGEYSIQITNLFYDPLETFTRNYPKDAFFN